MKSHALQSKGELGLDGDTIKTLKELLGRCTSLRASQIAAEQARRFEEVARFDNEAMILLLQIKDKAKLIDETGDAWQALYDEDPGVDIVVRNLINSHAKHRRGEDALHLINRHFPQDTDQRAVLIQRASMLEAIGFPEQSYETYERLIQEEPEDDRARLHYAIRLAKVGRLADAVRIIDPVAEKLEQDERHAKTFADWRAKVDVLHRLAPERDLQGVDCRILSLECLLRQFENREITKPRGRYNIALVTGGLGAGGAERQLSRLARLLKSEHGDLHKVCVVVKTLLLNEVKPNDFFLPDLQADEIEVVEIEAMEPVAAARQVDLDEDTALLFAMLPPQVHYGVTRLAPYYRKNKFNVASVWQDGATLYGCLAALFAGVPNIQLVFRGLPPSVRKERDQPEYEVLFKGMARIPGVTLVSNSKLVAGEYARWLEIEEDKVDILYNAVTAYSTENEAEDEEKWQKFAERTFDADTTLGGVFRLEGLKQPSLWVNFAAHYYERFPKSRFILLGDGRMRETLKKQIASLGLTDRFLLVGRTRSVGFWYEKMDVKLLLSQFEGLPNVLIEAQAAGVPVLATPTGGSSECFVEGETGYILDDILEPDLNMAVEKAHELATRFREDAGGQPGRARLCWPEIFR
ncbi:glycosyltransferase [Aurantiacibacter rhizosphaerae]|uniref:Glycosyltransferase n=1 Tax=Aurantiacibacter rhizosphaerae TaxID=2691582 RepID=A0A844X8E6_9SPHN|nr:glycosyltransferase [Aurantiacibacter rhizosphaerae]MWV26651.1 glycosyltransferase [Aurantiacibacter rhizosphaerae]